MYQLETQKVLTNILKGIVEDDKSIEEFLQDILDTILNLPWLSFISKGSIFLTNKDGNIKMVAQKGLDNYLLKHCKILKPGQCLCGKALQRKKMLFSNCLTDEHDIRPTGMVKHGHYNVPFIHEDEVLGILNLYVKHKHIKKKYEVEFLNSISIIIASIIKKENLNKLSKNQAKEQKILNKTLMQKNSEIEFQNQEILQKNEELLQQNEEIRTINENLEESQARIKTQAALALVLKGVTEHNKSIKEFLQNALEAILSLPWLRILAKGSIFLTNKDGNIKMVAQKGLGDYLLKTCKIIKPGQCLCGKALQRKKMLFSNHVTDEHDVKYTGMIEHGHYNVPLIFNDEVLGVLNLYVNHGYQKKDYEVEFLKSASIVIASEIKKQQLEKLAFLQAEKQMVLNKELVTINQKMNESINYAKSIQNSLLPNKIVIQKLLKEHFIFYRSKELVGGDFYYVTKLNNYLIFTVADCTGHGVAGAFLSILGVTYLNNILKRDKIIEPNKILEFLRYEIKNIFQQFGHESKNGMDMALCVLDTETNILDFSGAYNSVYIIRNGKLIELKGTKSPVGKYPREKIFEKQSIKLKNNDCIYLFSDGYYDQFGNIKGIVKKFMKKNFNNLILKISNKQMEEQRKILSDTFLKWKGEIEQIDDITVLGIRWKNELKTNNLYKN